MKKKYLYLMKWQQDMYQNSEGTINLHERVQFWN